LHRAVMLAKSQAEVEGKIEQLQLAARKNWRLYRKRPTDE